MGSQFFGQFLNKSLFIHNNTIKKRERVERPVEHFRDGRHTWKLGLTGFLLRYRGLSFTVIFTLITMGAPWWWPVNAEITTIKLSQLLTGAIFFLGTLGFILVAKFRKEAIRTSEVRWQIHHLAHFLRDKFTYYCEQSRSTDSPPDHYRNQDFRSLLIEICERLRDYFRSLTSDETVEIAIRLAVKQQLTDPQSPIVYRTIARSAGLNQARETTTEDIPSHEGIPRFLMHDKNSQGVLLYKDLKAADSLGTYKFTKNDELYGDDIKTMMVAPMNAWDGKSQSMIGILYVTSRKEKTFSAKLVEPIGFASDAVANAIATIVNELKKVNREPSLHRR